MESAIRLPSDPDFRVIETMLWTPCRGVHNRAAHLARLDETLRRLGIEGQDTAPDLDIITGEQAMRVRLTVDRLGRVNITSTPFVPLPVGTIWKAEIAPERLCSDDPFLRVKTSKRDLYDRTRAALGSSLDEALFLNERDELCEGTITNVFVDFGTGMLTPPQSCGLLPGILRTLLLSEGRAREDVILAQDLRHAKSLYVGNALRGLIPVHLV